MTTLLAITVAVLIGWSVGTVATWLTQTVHWVVRPWAHKQLTGRDLEIAKHD